MEFFLADPDIPRMSPVETRLLELYAEPYPDGKRLRVVLELTPFQERPYLNLILSNSAGEIVAEASIIELAVWKLDPTLHIRNPGATNRSPYKLVAILSYPSIGKVDHREFLIEIPSPSG